MIKLAVSGCCGKMGRRIIALACADREFSVAGAIECQAHPAIGRALSQVLRNPTLEVNVVSNPEVIKDADVLIEFSNPAGTMDHLISAVKFRKPVVIGTTGLKAKQAQKVQDASIYIPIMFSPNMSVGVNLVFKLVREAAQKLAQDYKVDIVEAHHVDKKDAPSGTAKKLAELIKQSQAREKEHIKIESIREDKIVGDHQVRFNSAQDVIIIKHSAKTRDIFAQGALAAAKFVVGKSPGLYDMQNVIEG